jgi:hypothetical protein
MTDRRRTRSARPRFQEAFPQVAQDLSDGLERRGRSDLVAQLPSLEVHACGLRRPSGLGWVDFVPEDEAGTVMSQPTRERVWLVRRDHVKWPMRVEVVAGAIWTITLDEPRNLKPDLERVAKTLPPTHA